MDARRDARRRFKKFKWPKWGGKKKGNKKNGNKKKCRNRRNCNKKKRKNEPYLQAVNVNGKNLGLCQGDCDYDKDCGRGLKCFHRHGHSQGKVRGCRLGGSGDRPAWDYCVKKTVFQKI